MITRRSLLNLLPTVIIYLLVLCTHTFADLNDEIQLIVESSNIGTTTIAYSCMDMSTGDVYTALNENKLMTPASNMKLLTTGAALLVLGPDFKFETKLYLTDDGKLYIIGSGDPALADPDLLRDMDITENDLIQTWIDDILKLEDSQKINTLIVDDRIFDNQRTHPAWEKDDLIREYGAEVSGFNFYRNIIEIHAQPARTIGLAPDFQVSPDVTGIVNIINNARTIKPGGRPAAAGLWLDRPDNVNNFTLYGDIQSPQLARVTVINQPEIFAQLMAQKLNKAGLNITQARVANADDPKITNDDNAKVIGHTIATPLSTIITRCNTDSENLYAESLIKRLGNEVTGQAGSWDNGSAIIRMLLSKKLGPALATEAIVSDGSGLSRDNKISANLITSWMYMIYKQEQLRDIFLDSLAEAGKTGTLKKRFNNTNTPSRILAKSGYIRQVSCLTGYIIAPNGRAAAFSILCNDIPQSGSNAISISQIKKLQEKIVLKIDEHLSQLNSLAESPEYVLPAEQLGG